MSHIKKTAELFSRFPGIGKKTALRLVYFLLQEKKQFPEMLGKMIQELPEYIFPCEVCGNLTDQTPCEICNNPQRDHTQLCVVAHPQDIQALEDSQSFSGVYHVLGGLISPLERVGPDKLTIDALKARIDSKQFSEVILATNPSIEGESTARYIMTICENDLCTFSRIAQGMPMGGDFEYTDRFTIAHALNSRISMG